jgi:hypothetical protein
MVSPGRSAEYDQIASFFYHSKILLKRLENESGMKSHIVYDIHATSAVTRSEKVDPG